MFVVRTALDFNLHMNNSIFARELDASRMQGFLDFFTPLFQAGGWVGLGSSYYMFYKVSPSPYPISYHPTAN